MHVNLITSGAHSLAFTQTHGAHRHKSARSDFDIYNMNHVMTNKKHLASDVNSIPHSPNIEQRHREDSGVRAPHTPVKEKT